jgi:Rhodopirellula transposase DDE domain
MPLVGRFSSETFVVAPGSTPAPLTFDNAAVSEITGLARSTINRGEDDLDDETVRSELTKLGFSRQSNGKADEGSKHPDRNAQFEHINTKVVAARFGATRHLGRYQEKGTGRQLQERRYRPSPKRQSGTRQVHDFEDKALGKVVPYGVYDVTANAGWVNVGITSDTAEFAVQSIRE